MSLHQGGSADGTNTHKSKYYRVAYTQALEMVHGLFGIIVDPFARECNWADLTNDINPAYKTTSNMDCVDFLKSIKSNSVRLVLFDPPFSQRQCDEKYADADSNLYTTNKIGNCHREIERILVPGGILLKLGYNSNRPSISFETVRINLVRFGGNRNDVICSFHKKIQYKLSDFEEV